MAEKDVAKPFGSLSGIRAVVTGSSSGIGSAIALELACGGADVGVHCRRSVESAQKVADQIRSLGRRAEVLTADLADHHACQRLIEQAWEVFGGIDVWINNAGADVLTGENLRLSYAEKLDLLMRVDVAAAIELSRDIGQRMSDSGKGVILNIGWDQADRGMEGVSGEVFAASKNAVMGFTRSFAVSLAPNVRVNCIAPGWIKTAWGETASGLWQERVLRETPLRRWGTPQDIAKMVRFLCSEDSSFITGQVINVNGGAVR